MEDPKEPEAKPEEEEAVCSECCNFKCAVITALILLLVDFFLEVVQLYFIYENDHFDPIYW